MNYVKTMVACLLGLSVFLLSFGNAVVSEAANTLPPGLVIGDSEGIYATSEGEYFVDIGGLLPGETYKKEITIRSLDLEEPFSLGLLAEEVSTKGSIDWKKHITLVLTLDGEEIYQGPLLGNGEFDWTKTPLELGVCKYGTDKILQATFTTNSALTNEDYREESQLEFYWTFIGTRDQPTEPTNPTEPTKPTEPTRPSESREPTESTSSSDSTVPTESSDSGSGRGVLPGTGGPTGSPTSRKFLPQTGEQVVYMFLSGLLLVLIVLFLWKKRREEEQE